MKTSSPVKEALDDDFPFSSEYNWQDRQMIGQGGFATVYKVLNKKTGQPVAVKQMAMYKFDADYKKQALLTEIQAMKQCQSPYIVKMYNSFIGQEYTYLVLQLCEQNLKQFMDKKLMLSQEEVASIIYDIIQGYKAIREKGYIHRDVKPKNILRKGKNFKITDFGFARKYNYNSQKLVQICGTQLYMAPQLLYQKEYTDKCDVWSFGLIVYELLFGYSAWNTRYYETYKKEVVTREVHFPYSYPIGENTKDFIQRCLELEETGRMSLEQMAEHPFVKNKDPGTPVKYREIEVKMQNILGRIQRSSQNKLINTRKIFPKDSQKQPLLKPDFYNLLLHLDPQITTYQSSQLFFLADISQDGKVHLPEFRQLFTEIDYKPPRDYASRLIEEIVRIARDKEMKLRDFFNLFDRNQSHKIDPQEFGERLMDIVPRLSAREVQLLWEKFDKDKSGKIEWVQFVEVVSRDLTIVQKVDFNNFQRALRNVQYLINFLKERNVSPQQLFARKQGDSTRMSIGQFDGLVKSIKYAVSRDEVIEMFRLMDANDSDSIEIEEVYKLLHG